MDIIGSLVAVTAFLPLMLLIAFLIICSNPGTVIFRQKRLGRNGREFTIYKFRSMVVNAEEILKNDKKLYEEYANNSFTLDVERDFRVTRVGRFIRKSSLDELPQLFNVLKGDMSLVGPRPILKEELYHYAGRENSFLSIRPGMTGYWQVQGRQQVKYPERADMELYYIYNRNLWMDIKIIFKTIAVVLNKKDSRSGRIYSEEISA